MSRLLGAAPMRRPQRQVDRAEATAAEKEYLSTGSPYSI